MTAYELVFPFLIIVTIGIIVYVLTRHIPEAVEFQDSAIKKEKQRWWQVFWGKGESLLRYVRLGVSQLDSKLGDSINDIRAKKEKLGHSIKEYRAKRKPGSKSDVPEETEISQEEENIEMETIPEDKEALEEFQDDFLKVERSSAIQEPEIEKQEKIVISKKVEKPKIKSIPIKNLVQNAVGHEIIKTKKPPVNFEVEKQQYWKKKEEMLIQSIIREPKNVGLYLQLGRLYFNQRNWKDAKQAFEQVLKIDKTNIKAKEELKRIEKYMNV